MKPSGKSRSRWLRLKALATELDVSDPKFGSFLPMGIHFTKLGGILGLNQCMRRWTNFAARADHPVLSAPRDIKINQASEQ
jgi:hypothetical protein